MKLSRLLSGLPPDLCRLVRPTPASPDPDISALAYDSRTVRPGTLFFALPGARLDGAAFVPDALARGAAAILHAPPAWPAPPAVPAAELLAPSPRLAMGLLADAFHARPSAALRLSGITGTNGKTTTTFLLRALLRAAGRPAGLLGTVLYDVGDPAPVPADRTMPEAPDTHALLARARQNGLADVAMEVSSQGLAAERAAGLRFAALGFTHLTGDHLDFHHTMEAYFQAKRRLFAELAPAAPALLNHRCPYARRLRQELAERSPARTLWTFALDDPSATLSASRLRPSPSGTTFDLHTPAGDASDLHLPLPGRYNVENLLLAFGLALLAQAPFAPMAAAVSSLQGAPGRMQLVPDPDPARALRCFVDYAHTDDALRNVLATLRPSTTGRLWVVFGCGGDRDPTKRPRMGAVAAELADVAILTSDNPRSEPPDAILRDILAGTSTPSARATILTEPDRAAAIALALRSMAPGDTLLVAGKGHETGQLAHGILTPFDDASVLHNLLRA